MLEEKPPFRPYEVLYIVTPPISNGDFPKVVVTLDLETRRVSEIAAYSRALTGEACSARLARLEAAIERKHGTRPSFSMRWNVHHSGGRSVELLAALPTSTTTLDL